jgi:bHLH factor
MAPTTPANHDPALCHPAPTPTSQPPQPIPPNIISGDLAASLQLDQTQLMNLLRSLPGVFTKLTEGQSSPKEGALGIDDPGPSSHPRGPPNLGQLSAVAMQAAPVIIQQHQDDDVPDQGQNVDREDSDSPSAPGAGTTANTGGRRSARSTTMGSDEWTRQRKDNHKEVERRRRGNINEGINELGRLVPNGSGEKAKGAILSRAVQYIHHLKENEARNIEKWTLEKLLMDQAMGDLQAQLEEVKRRWEEENMLRSRAETELEALKSMNGISGNTSQEEVAGTKRRGTEGAGKPQTEGVERDGKRQRTD